MWRRNFMKGGVGATGVTLMAQSIGPSTPIGGRQESGHSGPTRNPPAMSTGGLSKARLSRTHNVMLMAKDGRPSRQW